VDRLTTIVIVGARIGGLTAGLALLQQGIDVAVYEHAEALGEIGAGAQISEARRTPSRWCLGQSQRPRHGTPALVAATWDLARNAGANSFGQRERAFPSRLGINVDSDTYITVLRRLLV
jgi:2-polyprenyl-6-methoxyphenol hydroxylase-like FAD-dependent oxidoreductase